MLDGVKFGEEVVALVKGYVEREVAPLKAENAELKERIAALEARPEPEKGEKGEDGVSPAPEAVAAALLPIAEEMIGTAVATAVAELPPAEPGPPGEKGEKGEPGERGTDGRDGADGKDGQDGKDAAGIVEALKDSGELVLTLQDGRLIRTGIRDGKDGEKGRDGFGFDDMDACVLDDDRTIEFSFSRGEEEKCFTFKWPTVIYRGVWVEGETYQPGDAVTWAGSLHVAERETAGKPETKDGGWRLAVKRGRDGKDGKSG